MCICYGCYRQLNFVTLDVLHMLWRCAYVMDVIVSLIWSLFCKFELGHFSGILTMNVNRQWVPCVRNTSYRQFYPDSFETYRCPDHGLKMCMSFGYNPPINLRHYSRNLNLVVLSGQTVEVIV